MACDNPPRRALFPLGHTSCYRFTAWRSGGVSPASWSQHEPSPVPPPPKRPHWLTAREHGAHRGWLLAVLVLSVAARGAFAQDTGGSSATGTTGGTSTDIIVHPLLESASVDAVWTDRTLSAASLYPELRVFEGAHADAAGVVGRSRGVTLRTATADTSRSAGGGGDTGAADTGAPGLAPAVAAPMLDSSVEGWLADPPAADALLDIWIGLDRLSFDPVVSVEQELAIAMLEGRVVTAADVTDVKQDVHTRREAAGMAALDPLLTWADSLGVEVEEIAPAAGLVRVLLPARYLDDVVALDGVVRVEAASLPTVDDAGYSTTVEGPRLDMFEVADLLQTWQFYMSGALGSGGFQGNERIGLTEPSGDNVFRHHPGFDDEYGVDRVTNCPVAWLGDTCTGNPDPTYGGDHATATASILIGDITPQCMGTTHFSAVWNSMYEEGLALFNSAGNAGHGDPTDCTTTDPAAAIGEFTVGAYNVLDSGVLPPGPYTNPTPTTSRGGTSTEGGGRTIIDMMAPTQLWWAYPAPMTAEVRYGADWDVKHDDGTKGPYGDGSPDNFSKTSAATPTVSGAAVIFRQAYLDEYSSLIDSPGILYANLLLMGDRRAEGGSYLATGYDGLWGAGHLHLRKWKDDAMDAPWAWETGYVCVDNGSTVTIPMADYPVPQGVDIVKAVAWWYDHRHDSGTPHDLVRLTIQKDNGSTTQRIQDAVGDNKQRVVDFDPAGWTLTMELNGANVTSDKEGCGTDSTRVYYAWYWEDQSRDDAGKPLLDYVRPE